MDVNEFSRQLIEAGAQKSVAKFIWDEFEPDYFAPLTPHDRPISEFKIDPDDLSDMVMKFEKQFGRRWLGKWIGPDDPTLIEFAHGLMNSTSEH